jgi:hypothetical protein
MAYVKRTARVARFAKWLGLLLVTLTVAGAIACATAERWLAIAIVKTPNADRSINQQTELSQRKLSELGVSRQLRVEVGPPAASLADSDRGKIEPLPDHGQVSKASCWFSLGDCHIVKSQSFFRGSIGSLVVFPWVPNKLDFASSPFEVRYLRHRVVMKTSQVTALNRILSSHLVEDQPTVPGDLDFVQLALRQGKVEHFVHSQVLCHIVCVFYGLRHERHANRFSDGPAQPHCSAGIKRLTSAVEGALQLHGLSRFLIDSFSVFHFFSLLSSEPPKL